ncbi:MAG TPA: hypothetical protein VF377_08735 [Acidimicrobiia bacterium]
MATRREQEIIAAYDAWDPEVETVNELADRIGVSRSRLYEVLRRHNVELKTRTRSNVAPNIDSLLLQEMAENALSFLLTQLQQCRDELREYRDRYGPL